MPSFDVVSEIDHHELTNAIDQANREIGTRFDFKGTDSKIEQDDNVLTLDAPSDFQVKQVKEVLYQKMSKRGLDIQSIEAGAMETRGTRCYQKLTVREGIEKELAKKIVKKIKDAKLKVQAAVQGEQVRVTGKKRDDLQQVIAMLREADMGLPLQFNNFRD